MSIRWNNSLLVLILFSFGSSQLLFPLPAANLEEYIVRLPDTTVKNLKYSTTDRYNHYLAKILPSTTAAQLRPVFRQSPSELLGWFVLQMDKSDKLALAQLQTNKDILHFQKNNHYMIGTVPPDDSLYAEYIYSILENDDTQNEDSQDYTGSAGLTYYFGPKWGTSISGYNTRGTFDQSGRFTGTPCQQTAFRIPKLSKSYRT